MAELPTFLQIDVTMSTMLSDKDIDRLVAVFKTIFPTREDFEELEAKFEDLKDEVGETQAIAQTALVKVEELKGEVEETKVIARQTLAAVEPLASFIDKQRLENAATTTDQAIQELDPAGGQKSGSSARRMIETKYAIAQL